MIRYKNVRIFNKYAKIQKLMEILETLCCHNSFLLNFYSKLNFVNYLKMNKIQIKNIKVCSKVLSFIHSRVVLEKNLKLF